MSSSPMHARQALLDDDVDDGVLVGPGSSYNVRTARHSDSSMTFDARSEWGHAVDTATIAASIFNYEQPAPRSSTSHANDESKPTEQRRNSLSAVAGKVKNKLKLEHLQAAACAEFESLLGSKTVKEHLMSPMAGGPQIKSPFARASSFKRGNSFTSSSLAPQSPLAEIKDTPAPVEEEDIKQDEDEKKSENKWKFPGETSGWTRLGPLDLQPTDAGSDGVKATNGDWRIGGGEVNGWRCESSFLGGGGPLEGALHDIGGERFLKMWNRPGEQLAWNPLGRWTPAVEACATRYLEVVPPTAEERKHIRARIRWRQSTSKVKHSNRLQAYRASSSQTSASSPSLTTRQNQQRVNVKTLNFQGPTSSVLKVL